MTETDKLDHCPDRGASFFRYGGAVEHMRRENQLGSHHALQCDECGGWHVVRKIRYLRGEAA